jgi:hypothetical protein
VLSGSEAKGILVNCGAQGHAMNFKSTDENGKDNPLSAVTDITVRYADIQDAGSGVKFTDWTSASVYPCQRLRRFALQHVAVREVGNYESDWLHGGGRSLNLSGDLDELVLDNLTLLGRHSSVEQEYGTVTRSTLRNCVLRDNTYDLRLKGDVAGLFRAGNVTLSPAQLAALGPRPAVDGVGIDWARYDAFMQHVPDFSEVA